MAKAPAREDRERATREGIDLAAPTRCPTVLLAPRDERRVLDHLTGLRVACGDLDFDHRLLERRLSWSWHTEDRPHTRWRGDEGRRRWVSFRIHPVVLLDDLDGGAETAPTRRKRPSESVKAQGPR